VRCRIVVRPTVTVSVFITQQTIYKLY